MDPTRTRIWTVGRKVDAATSGRGREVETGPSDSVTEPQVSCHLMSFVSTLDELCKQVRRRRRKCEGRCLKYA